MNTYLCTYGGEWPENIVAETASKARYKYYNGLELCESYSEVFRFITSKLKHKFRVSDLFGDKEQFSHVIKYRGIEFAKIGMRCEVNGNKGTITGASNGCNLAVCYDGNAFSYNSHPYWKFKYFDDEGKLIAEDGKLIESPNASDKEEVE